MAQIKWTLQAVDDLASIAEFITKDSPYYAHLFVISIVGSIDRLSNFPKSGRIVPEIKNPLIREIIAGNYRIIYQFQTKTVEILTIYHGAKLLNASKIKVP